MMKKICLSLTLLIFYAKAQTLYIKPMLIGKINNYSSNFGQHNFRFEKNAIQYTFDIPNYHLNPRVNYGLDIGLKGKFYFFEMGISLDQATSDLTIKIEYNNQKKNFTYHNQVDLFKSSANFGLLIFDCKSNRKLGLKHTFWFRMGVDFAHAKESLKYYNEVSNFTISDADFQIANSYYIPKWKFYPLLNLGLDYHLESKSGMNLLCLNISYLYNRSLTGSLVNDFRITQSNKISNAVYFYAPPNTFSGIYISLSKEFNLQKKRNTTESE